MGVPYSGKSFKIQTIDVHNVGTNFMLLSVYHVEDWASAIHQLQA